MAPTTDWDRLADAQRKFDEAASSPRGGISSKSPRLVNAVQKALRSVEPRSLVSEPLSHRVWGTKSATPRTVQKAGKTIVGRVRIDDDILIVEQETDREAVIKYLKAQGYQPRDVIRHADFVPGVVLRASDHRGGRTYEIGTGFGSDDVTLQLGWLYAAGELMSADPGLDATISQALNHAGLAVTKAVATAPLGYRADTRDESVESFAYAKMHVENAQAAIKRSRCSNSNSEVSLNPTQKRSTPVGLRPTIAERVPDQVVIHVGTWVRRVRARQPAPRFGYPSKLGYAAIADDVAALAAHLATPFALPRPATGIGSGATEHFPQHALAIAA